MLQWAISRKPNLTYFTISYRVGSSETTREAHKKKYEDDIVRSAEKFTVNNKCQHQYPL